MNTIDRIIQTLQRGLSPHNALLNEKPCDVVYFHPK